MQRCLPSFIDLTSEVLYSWMFYLALWFTGGKGAQPRLDGVGLLQGPMVSWHVALWCRGLAIQSVNWG